MYEFFFVLMPRYMPFLLEGAVTTILISVTSMTFAVILGLLHASALMTPDDTPASASPALQTALGRVASEEEVVLTATRKLTLQCGAASISLDLDGNIEIRGENLLSRASRQNRIKGSSISLN